MKMSEKYKSTSPIAVQVKKWWETIDIEEKLDVMNWLQGGEQIFTYIVMLGVLILAYVQFMIMLIELQKTLLEVKHICSKTATVLSEWTMPKALDASLCYFYCIRNK